MRRAVERVSVDRVLEDGENRVRSTQHKLWKRSSEQRDEAKVELRRVQRRGRDKGFEKGGRLESREMAQYPDNTAPAALKFALCLVLRIAALTSCSLTEHPDRMSLNVMTLQPRCEDVETQRGVALTVTAVAQVMVMAEDALATDTQVSQGLAALLIETDKERETTRAREGQ